MARAIAASGEWLASVYDALAEAGIEPPAPVSALPGPKPSDEDDDGPDAE